MRANDSRDHRLSSQDVAQRLEKDDERARGALAVIQKGHFQEASAVLADLRNQYGSGNVPRMMIRILLIEACLQYYKDRSPQALDRSRRALALSSASDFSDLESETAVWHALFCFNFDKYLHFGQSLAIAFRGFDQLPESLRARFCLLVADCFQFFGEFQTSDKWYLCARVYSRRAVDRPLMAAIEYNRIIMALSYLRLTRFLYVEHNLIDRKNWIEEIHSVRRLHAGLQIDALEELLLLGESLARQSSNEYLGSATALERIRAQDAAHICGLSKRQLDLEITWCRALAGTIESSEELNLPSMKQIGEWSFAEQVTALKQLEEIYQVLEVSFDAAEFHHVHSIAANQCREADRELRSAIEGCRDMLAAIESSVLGR